MTEHTKAQAWREAHGLDRKALAELTGFSVPTIYWYEKGIQPPSKKHEGQAATAPWVWQRYKLACAAVDRFLRTGEKFDWEG